MGDGSLQEFSIRPSGEGIITDNFASFVESELPGRLADNHKVGLVEPQNLFVTTHNSRGNVQRLRFVPLGNEGEDGFSIASDTHYIAQPMQYPTGYSEPGYTIVYHSQAFDGSNRLDGHSVGYGKHFGKAISISTSNTDSESGKYNRLLSAGVHIIDNDKPGSTDSAYRISVSYSEDNKVLPKVLVIDGEVGLGRALSEDPFSKIIPQDMLEKKGGVTVLRALLENGSQERDGLEFSLIKGGHNIIRESGEVVSLDLVRILRRNSEGKVTFDLVVPIGLTCNDIMNKVKKLAGGEDILADPLNAPSADDQSLYTADILAAVGIEVKTSGIETRYERALQARARSLELHQTEFRLARMKESFGSNQDLMLVWQSLIDGRVLLGDLRPSVNRLKLALNPLNNGDIGAGGQDVGSTRFIESGVFLTDLIEYILKDYPDFFKNLKTTQYDFSRDILDYLMFGKSTPYDALNRAESFISTINNDPTIKAGFLKGWRSMPVELTKIQL